MGEFDIIDKIKALCQDLPTNGFEGIGDDCAIFNIDETTSLVYTSDMLIEGVHFLRNATSARELGSKSLAVNISDVASMGAKPIASLLSISIPKDATSEWIEQFMEGYHALSQQHDVALVGGDTTSSLGAIAINVTAIGIVPTANLKRRSMAQVGDTIYCSAPVGESATGLRDILAGELDTPMAHIHRNPTPEIEAGKWLGAQQGVGAMMDISDGIASDLRHILRASKVGARIDLEKIPTPTDLHTALCGGEDYKLLFTVRASNAQHLEDQFHKEFNRPIYPIGTITQGDTLKFYENGAHKELDWMGFRHY